MIAKKGILLCLSFCFCSFAAFADRLNLIPTHYGEVSVSSGSTDSILLKDSADTTTEAFYKGTLSLYPYLAARATIKGIYSSIGSEATVEHLLLDYRGSDFGIGEYGIRVGRIPLPYGFTSDKEYSPFYRQYISSPLTQALPTNTDFYRRGDGYEFYLSGYYKSLSYYAEAGDMTRTLSQERTPSFNPYFTGVSFEKVTSKFVGVKLKYNNMRFRWDEIRPTQTYKITEKHWTDYVKVLPKAYWILGNYSSDFSLGLQAYQIFLNHFSVMLEHYTIKYADEKEWSPYYDLFRSLGKTFDRKVNDYKIVHLDYKYDRTVKVSAGQMGKYLNSDSQLEGRTRWVQTNYKITKDLILKVQVLKTEGVYWVLFTPSDNTKLVKDAVSLFTSITHKW